eukprot:4760781-Amphidinium_carterae.2
MTWNVHGTFGLALHPLPRFGCEAQLHLLSRFGPEAEAPHPLSCFDASALRLSVPMHQSASHKKHSSSLNLPMPTAMKHASILKLNVEENAHAFNQELN